MTARRRHAPQFVTDPVARMSSDFVRLALPVARLVVPMRSALFPAGGNPMIPRALTHPTAWDPDMLVSAPFPEPRRPNEAYARSRQMQSSVRQSHSRPCTTQAITPFEKISFNTPFFLFVQLKATELNDLTARP
jgi:hypothetical protein